MDSPKWKKKRKVAIDRSRGYCENCGAKSRLEVHHVTYDRFGQEDPNDLLAVCVPCHQVMDRDRQFENKWFKWIKRVSAFMCKVYGPDWNDEFSVEEANREFCRYLSSSHTMVSPDA
jgi:hypothetical protein